MTTFRFGRFDHLTAQITGADGRPVATTRREGHGTSLEVHSADGPLLCRGGKPRRMTRKHEEVDGEGRCSVDVDPAVLIGIVETHHVLEADRPTKAQERASLDAMGQGGVV